MAISTLDGAIAGVKPPVEFFKVGATMEAAGVMHSMFYTSGAPGAAVAPTPGINGAALTSYSGQLPFSNPVSGNSYLMRATVNATSVGTLYICDRLWHNSGIGITTTTLQAITTPSWPARDMNGSTNGVGVMVGLEASAAIGGGAVTNTTLNYTDQDGNTGNVATMASWPATAVAGTFVPFQLAAGDTGVRAITAASGGGLTLGTTYTSGTIHLVAYRVLATLSCTIANVEGAIDAISGGFVRLYDNTVPFLLWRPSATTATTISGQFVYTQG